MKYLRNKAIISLRSALRLTLIATVAISATYAAFAGSATWKSNPTTGDWNTAANWTPETVPNGVSDVATFQQSNVTGILTSAVTNVGAIVFDTNASEFTISVRDNFVFNGAGIINNSGTTQLRTRQHFICPPPAIISFLNSAAIPGCCETTFNVGGGAVSNGPGGLVRFDDASDAGAGTFTLNGGTAAGAAGGKVQFNNSATAGGSILNANGGSNGGKGGLIEFRGHSDGRFAHAELFGNGSLVIDQHAARAVRLGCIGGDGIVVLGANRLTLPTSCATASFSGTIKDGPNGVGGSLRKAGFGIGTLTLSGTNTYTGGTVVDRGGLMINNASGSGTGTGPVFVNGGQLGGTGTVAGAVTIGDGNTPGAFLIPGATATAVGRLIIQSALTFNSDAIYGVQINSTTATADKVVANGVTINISAQFSFTDLGSGTLPMGTVFTLINNTSASPIAGRFSNLADGFTFTLNGNTYRASYEAGDGNDLTLTVQ